MRIVFFFIAIVIPIFLHAESPDVELEKVDHLIVEDEYGKASVKLLELKELYPNDSEIHEKIKKTAKLILLNQELESIHLDALPEYYQRIRKIKENVQNNRSSSTLGSSSWSGGLNEAETALFAMGTVLAIGFGIGKLISATTSGASMNFHCYDRCESQLQQCKRDCGLMSDRSKGPFSSDRSKCKLECDYLLEQCLGGC